MVTQADFLIIGSGLAGLNAALRLADRGEVLVLCKRHPGESNTAYAQGGLASVTSEEDSFEDHVKDTLEAGAGLCDPDVVQAIVSEGPRAVERLVTHGVKFDAFGESYDLTREGGHSNRRILHSKDVTGREIDRALREKVGQHPRITILPHHTAIDLITTTGSSSQTKPRCVGAYVLNATTGKILTIRARAILLATGGAGKAYLYTSNPDVSTGDGVAMAYRAGASIANMEFFQFHPTCLFHPHAKSFLISEALRGEGGILRRRDGVAFMQGIHPRADLAPRDVVARAIDQEMKRTGDDYVTLDMTEHDPAVIVRRFPNIHTACLSLGIDMTKVPIPVVPAAHYMCGGVKTNLRGQTDVPGLWAAGESGCTGLHGANRLASNSLLEATVMSEWAAEDMAAQSSDVVDISPIREWDSGTATDPDEMVVVSHNWDEVRRTMWNYVGIVRSDKRLARAAKRVEMLQEEIHEYYWNFKLTHDLIELRNLATITHLIVAAAQHRRESRGLHFNIDTPTTSEDWERNTVFERKSRKEILWHHAETAQTATA